MQGRLAGLILLAAIAVPNDAARAQQIPEAVTPDVLRVCADPANLPFSNRRGGGFENKIAELVARELKVPLRYYWSPQGPGFVRNTLQTGLCDLIMGYAAGAEPVQHTNPYYRSVYVLIVRQGGDLEGVDTLADPRLRHRPIGVTAATPPVDHLNALGLMADAQPYALLVDHRSESPGERMIADVAAGRIEAALLWGPIGGYFARKATTPLTIVPLVKETAGTPLSYRITLGLRAGEQDWKHRLNEVLRRRRDDIVKILSDFGVPLLDGEGRPVPPPSGAAERAPAQ